MKLIKNNRRLLLSAPAVLASLALASSAQGAVHLAFGVDTLDTSTNYNRIVVRDLHGDHYHSFSQNNGTPGSHTPEPLTLVPGSASSSIDLASMDISPYSQSRYTTTAPGADFHLELVGVTGVDTDSLIVLFWHDDHTHTMSVGGSAEHLELSEINRIEFQLADGAALGSYSAQFQLVDESGTFTASPAFTIHANAVPEPTSVLLGALAAVPCLLSRKRR